MIWESTKKVERRERVRRGIYRGEEMLTVEVELEMSQEMKEMGDEQVLICRGY